jgi:hypothetical protein
LLLDAPDRLLAGIMAALQAKLVTNTNMPASTGFTSARQPAATILFIKTTRFPGSGKLSAIPRGMLPVRKPKDMDHLRRRPQRRRYTRRFRGHMALTSASIELESAPVNTPGK